LSELSTFCSKSASVTATGLAISYLLDWCLLGDLD
jgi:hypothetical protein